MNICPIPGTCYAIVYDVSPKSSGIWQSDSTKGQDTTE
jgi:hypothetical protein